MTRDDARMVAQMECIALDLAELNAALTLVHGLVLCLGRQEQAAQRCRAEVTQDAIP